MATTYEAAMAECRKGRELDHFLTFLMGQDLRVDKRGHWFWPDGKREQHWEIVEVYRDGTFAACDRPRGSIKLFESSVLGMPR